MARPRADVDPELVEQLAGIGCSLREIAAACHCSVDTIERNFAEEVAKGRQTGRTSLRRKQLEVAMAGNVTMLIWLGKQMLDQSDRTQIGGMEGNPLRTDSTVSLPPDAVQSVMDYVAQIRERMKAKAAQG